MIIIKVDYKREPSEACPFIIAYLKQVKREKAGYSSFPYL